MSESLSYTLPEHLRARRAARRRELGVQMVAVVLAVLCIVGAGLLLDPMNEIRRERQLVIDPDSTKGLPSDIALLGRLGTFRALAIDWASIRADRLKEEGKTYEALQLHETVCALAPRYPKVWANAAWNMAYNISVMQYSPESRWKWVRNGIELLRDKGIQYNPKSVTLYRELAWIYWHKIGDILDDEHLNYKRALAVEMERILGAPPITVEDEEYFDWFREIVNAPQDLERLAASDPAVRDLVARLAEVNLAPGEPLLEFIARTIRPELRRADLLRDAAATDPQEVRRLEIVTDPKETEPLQRLLATVRSKVLRERYKLDPQWMLHLMEDEYGPLDWRNGFAHTLYWSSLGDRESTGYEGADFADAVNTARLIFFSLQSLIDRGRIVLYPDFDDPFSSYIDLTPDTRYIPYLYGTYMRLSKKHFGDDPEYQEGMPAKNYRNGFVTAMHNWIQYLYFEGGERNMELAENYYAWLRENNPHPDGSPQSRYLKTLDEFVMGDALNQLHTYRAASGLIRSMIQRALKQFALGHGRVALRSLELAQLCHDYWMKDADTDRNDRMKMQPMRVILRDQVQDFMKQPRIDPLFKARLWRELPLEQRQMAYDPLQPYFAELCATQDPPWDNECSFPEPPGMKEFRRREIRTIGPARREGVDEGERFKD